MDYPDLTVQNFMKIILVPKVKFFWKLLLALINHFHLPLESNENSGQ